MRSHAQRDGGSDGGREGIGGRERHTSEETTVVAQIGANEALSREAVVRKTMEQWVQEIIKRQSLYQLEEAYWMVLKE